jgi:hypothetical protein
MPSTSPPINSFQPADWKVNTSDSSSKSPLMMPHVSSESMELDEEVDEETDEDGVDVDEEELGATEDEEASAQATTNKAVSDDKTSKCFLFI